MDWKLDAYTFLTAGAAVKDALTGLAYVMILFAAAFAAFSAVCAGARRRSLRGRPAGGGDLPPVTMLKPLKGADRGLYENLASFCRQDYPEFQLIFALADPGDPARAVAERVRRDFPHRDISVVVSDDRIGGNPKVNNVANAYPYARHPLILVSDSDIRVPGDFLRRCAAPFSDPRVGLVTCFYRSAEAPGVWGLVEALTVNAHFLPQALLAGTCGMRFALGAAMLVRRPLFDRLGAFSALADHLADDFILGSAVAKAGYRVEFGATVVESMPPEYPSLTDVFSHQVRWQSTVRLCNPAGYAGSFLLHGFSLATIIMLVFGWNPDLAAAALLLAAVKGAAAWSVQRLTRGRMGLRAWLLLPVSEWLVFTAWLLGFGPRSVIWRGRSYRVLPEGRLVPAGAGSSRPARREPVLVKN